MLIALFVRSVVYYSEVEEPLWLVQPSLTAPDSLHTYFCGSITYAMGLALSSYPQKSSHGLTTFSTIMQVNSIIIPLSFKLITAVVAFSNNNIAITWNVLQYVLYLHDHVKIIVHVR